MPRTVSPPRRSRLFTLPGGPLLLEEPPRPVRAELPMYRGPLVVVPAPPRR